MTDFLIYDRVLSASEHKKVVKHLLDRIGIPFSQKPNGVSVDFWLAADERVYTDREATNEAEPTDDVLFLGRQIKYA